MLATKKNMGGIDDDFVCGEGLRKEGRMRSGTEARGRDGMYHVAEEDRIRLDGREDT